MFSLPADTNSLRVGGPEDQASTPASPDQTMAPSPERRINQWLDLHGVLHGSPGMRKREFFEHIKQTTRISNPHSPLIEFSLENSGLLKRRSGAQNPADDKLSKSEPFAVRPQKVPDLNS